VTVINFLKRLILSMGRQF